LLGEIKDAPCVRFQPLSKGADLRVSWLQALDLFVQGFKDRLFSGQRCWNGVNI
jgi:hypothetical protein